MRRALAVLAIAAAAVIAGAASPAFAHNFLVSATPAPGTTVTTQPGTIVVTTNDVLPLVDGAAGFGMLVQDAEGRYYGDGCVTVRGRGISMDAQLGPAGRYTVTWQVISTDSHPVSNSFVFDWKPATSEKLATGAAAVPDCHGTVRAAPAPPTGSGSVDSTVWWVAGGVAALVVAIVVTLVILRPRKREE